MDIKRNFWPTKLSTRKLGPEAFSLQADLMGLSATSTLHGRKLGEFIDAHSTVSSTSSDEHATEERAAALVRSLSRPYTAPTHHSQSGSRMDRPRHSARTLPSTQEAPHVAQETQTHPPNPLQHPRTSASVTYGRQEGLPTFVIMDSTKIPDRPGHNQPSSQSDAPLPSTLNAYFTAMESNSTSNLPTEQHQLPSRPTGPATAPARSSPPHARPTSSSSAYHPRTSSPPLQQPPSNPYQPRHIISRYNQAHLLNSMRPGSAPLGARNLVSTTTKNTASYERTHADMHYQSTYAAIEGWNQDPVTASTLLKGLGDHPSLRRANSRSIRSAAPVAASTLKIEPRPTSAKGLTTGRSSTGRATSAAVWGISARKQREAREGARAGPVPASALTSSLPNRPQTAPSTSTTASLLQPTASTLNQRTNSNLSRAPSQRRPNPPPPQAALPPRPVSASAASRTPLTLTLSSRPTPVDSSQMRAQLAVLKIMEETARTPYVPRDPGPDPDPPAAPEDPSPSPSLLRGGGGDDAPCLDGPDEYSTTSVCYTGEESTSISRSGSSASTAGGHTRRVASGLQHLPSITEERDASPARNAAVTAPVTVPRGAVLPAAVGELHVHQQQAAQVRDYLFSS